MGLLSGSETNAARREARRIAAPPPRPTIPVVIAHAKNLLGERMILNASPQACERFGGFAPGERVRDCFGQFGVVIGVGPAGPMMPRTNVLWIALDRDRTSSKGGVPVVVYYQRTKQFFPGAEPLVRI